MKAQISTLVWLPVAEIDPIAMYGIKRDLVIQPKVMGFGKQKEQQPVTIKLYQVSKDKVYVGVPRYYYSKVLKVNPLMTFEEEYKFSRGSPLSSIDLKIKLREDDQLPALQKVVAELTKNEFGHGMLEAYTGFGKSILSIALIRELGGTAIVIVPTNPIKDHWLNEMKTFWPDLKVGVIQGDKTDFKGYDVCVAMVQSMVRNPSKYDQEFWSYFRTIVVDEVHKFGAAAFSQVVNYFDFQYSYGCSGTMRRLDKAENVFRYLVGSTVFKASEKNRIRPSVYVKDTRYTPNPDAMYDGIEKPGLLTLICASKYRSKRIALDIYKSLKAGRNPIAIAERLNIMKDISRYVLEYAEQDGKSFAVGLYIGGLKESEKKIVLECDCIFATTQMVKEGMNLKRLDTLFMLTPMSDPEQAAGRIARRLKDKKPPMIVDYVDWEIESFRSSFKSRLRRYKKMGLKILNDNAVRGN